MSDDLDPEVYSTISIGDRRLTWREAYERERQERMDSAFMLTFVYDLDRCEHGRHKGDVCSARVGCDGASRGNVLVRDGDVVPIGHAMSGDEYVLRRPELRGQLPVAIRSRQDGSIRELGTY